MDISASGKRITFEVFLKKSEKAGLNRAVGNYARMDSLSTDGLLYEDYLNFFTKEDLILLGKKYGIIEKSSVAKSELIQKIRSAVFDSTTTILTCIPDVEFHVLCGLVENNGRAVCEEDNGNVLYTLLKKGICFTSHFGGLERITILPAELL